MQIGWYSHYFVPEIGAPPARLYDLSTRWRAAGHDVRVTTCFPNHPGGRLYPGYRRQWSLTETIDGITVERLWTWLAPNRGFFKKLLGHVSFLASSLVSGPFRLPVADVVVGTSPTFFAAMAAAADAARWKRPFIMEVRDLWPAIFVELGVLRDKRLIALLEKLEWSLYQRSARIVTVTESFRQILIGRGMPPERIVTIPNGADTQYWQPAADQETLRKQMGLQGRFVVLYIGAHGISHALMRIVDCAERLKTRPDIHFVFVGDGSEKSHLVAGVRERRLSNVTFCEPVDRTGVKRFYAMADLCLVPLRDIALFETFIPSKMFEIMAMGRPILASLKGEAAAILNASGGAMVVGPEDTSRIVDGIMLLCDQPDYRRRLGENGRLYVQSHFGRDLLAQRYLAMIEQVVAEAADRRNV